MSRPRERCQAPTLPINRYSGYPMSMRSRLTKITFRGFKTIRNLTDFEPGSLTLLIGPNGSGKSNFLSFFRLLSFALVPPGQLQIYVAKQGGATALLHQGVTVTQQIEALLTLSTDAGSNEYGFRLIPAAGDTLIFAAEWFGLRDPGQDRPAPGFGAGHREPQLIAEAGLNMLRRMIVHQFHNTAPTARIRGKWDVSDNRWLKEDGANLAPFLYRLMNERPEYYTRIVDTIRLMLPFFATFELYPEFDHVLLRWREIGSDHIFNASQASDGMLRAMALIALFQQPEPDLPDLLILDEPELGLHPYAIEVLASLIHSASRHVQVVVATQSVTLVDRFEPDDIVVLNRSGSETSFKRLSNTELAEWLETYTLSELWEKNVVGGRPSH
jgi:predicted ATPase